VISLSFSNLGGGPGGTVPENYFSQVRESGLLRDRNLLQLGQHYLGKLRYAICLRRTYKVFVTFIRFHPRTAPRFFSAMRVVDTFHQGVPQAGRSGVLEVEGVMSSLPKSA